MVLFIQSIIQKLTRRLFPCFCFLLLFVLSFCGALTLTAQNTPSKKSEQAQSNRTPNRTSNDEKITRAFRIDARNSPRGVVVGAAFFAPSADSKCDTVAALILRKASGEADFTQIARIERAATLEAAKARVFAAVSGQEAWESFLETAGASFSGAGFSGAGLSTANQIDDNEKKLWQALKNQPRRAVAALFLPYPSIGEALGMMYTDTTTLALPTGTVLTYAVRYVLRGGTSVAVEPAAGVRVVVGQPLRSLPPRLDDTYEKDSLVALRFVSPLAAEQQLRIAAIFRQIDGVGAFEQLPLFITPNTKGDTMVISFEDRVEPEHIIRYYVQMQDGVGNLGARSDTATVISIDQSRVQRITEASARDTTNGIFLRWKPLAAKPYFLGVEIARAVGAGGAYMPLDTVSLHDSTYLDLNVQSGREYFYSWRTIMLRPSPEVPLVWASAAHRNRTSAPLAPYSLEGRWEKALNSRATEKKQKVAQTEAGVRLLWQPSSATAEQDVSHYLVYRAPVGKPLVVQSKPLETSTRTYLDTDSTLDGRTTYTYAVRAVNFTGMESQNSHLVYVRPQKVFAPEPPAGVGVYEDAGVANVRWSAGANERESVVNFTIYRRLLSSSSAGWVRLARVSSSITFLQDTTVNQAERYEYAATATDTWGNESEKSATFRFALTEREITPPSRVYARAVGNDVEISWSEQICDDVREIVIYRRSERESTLKKIGSVQAQKTSFVDTNTNNEILYIYSLRVISTNNRESLPSREVSVRP